VYSEVVAGERCRCQPERLYWQHSTASRSVYNVIGAEARDVLDSNF